MLKSIYPPFFPLFFTGLGYCISVDWNTGQIIIPALGVFATFFVLLVAMWLEERLTTVNDVARRIMQLRRHGRELSFTASVLLDNNKAMKDHLCETVAALLVVALDTHDREVVTAAFDIVIKYNTGWELLEHKGNAPLWLVSDEIRRRSGYLMNDKATRGFGRKLLNRVLNPSETEVRNEPPPVKVRTVTA